MEFVAVERQFVVAVVVAAGGELSESVGPNCFVVLLFGRIELKLLNKRVGKCNLPSHRLPGKPGATLVAAPGGRIHDNAPSGVYDLGGSMELGRNRRSSVTLDWTRYCILQ